MSAALRESQRDSIPRSMCRNPSLSVRQRRNLFQPGAQPQEPDKNAPRAESPIHPPGTRNDGSGLWPSCRNDGKPGAVPQAGMAAGLWPSHGTSGACSQTWRLRIAVERVEKMLALVPKLRAAKNEKERAVLQNAVDSTDRKIDNLVYDLYGLTPDEIALVEQKN